MKSEDLIFSQRIERYELHDYATARYRANRAIAERDDVIDSLYDDCAPTITGVDYEEGRMYSTSTPVEDMAIMIIEKKECYEKMIQRYTTKAEAFEIAMGLLTPREFDVVMVAYQGAPNNLGLQPSYFNHVLREAEDKLCSYISKKQIQKEIEWKSTLKELRKEQVAGWKRHEVMVS